MRTGATGHDERHDFWHLTATRVAQYARNMVDTRSSIETGGLRSGRRKSQRAQEYAGLGFVLLSLLSGLIQLIYGPDPYIPEWIWLVLLLICLTSAFFPFGGALPRKMELAIYAIAVVSAWTLVITMPEIGMMIFLLIVVAVGGIYLVPIWLVIGITITNCVLVAVQMWAHGADRVDYLATGIFNFVVHLAVAFTVYTMARESVMRSGLEQKTTELEAASVLLEDSAKTAERLRISRELHDLMGHQLTVLNLELEAAKHREGAEARSHIDQAAAVAKALLADVRTTVGELRAAGPGSLLDALRRLASAVQSIDISVEVDEDVAVDEQQAEALVRAGQEIITNAVKHSEAKELWLTVDHNDSGTMLTGTNDGASPRTIVHGHGLQGLAERVELLGGSLTVRPRPMFTVEVRLPPCAARETSS